MFSDKMFHNDNDLPEKEDVLWNKSRMGENY